MRLMPSSRTLHILFALFLAFASARACGPDFSPDVFVRSNRPDLPHKYVTGRLGIVQPTFPRADLWVAYRYLNGGTLDAQEQKSWSPTYSSGSPEWMAQYNQPSNSPTMSTLNDWVNARRQYPGAPKQPINPQRGMEKHIGNYQYESSFLNCSDDAFRTATEVLHERANLWGQSSPALLNWLQAQDTVFSDCGGGNAIPAPVPAGGPALLITDRAYQIAAANFYSMKFEAARQEFVAISHDRTSRWQPIGGYLAARALVREAFFAKLPQNSPFGYNPTLMRQAEQQLNMYLASTPEPSLRNPAESLLALVRIRVDPAARAKELGALIAGPAHDPNYAQNVLDLLWFVGNSTPDGLQSTLKPWEQVPDAQHPGKMRPETQTDVDAQNHSVYMQTAAERSYSPLIDWTLTLESLDPAAAAHAAKQWQQTHSLPWLVAALTLANPQNTQVAPYIQPLLDAAAAVPVNSPAWETAIYHRIRLLLATGQGDQARVALANVLPHVHALGEPSSINAFRGLGISAAPSLAAFLKFTPRSVLSWTSEEYFSNVQCLDVMKENPKRHYNCVAQVSPSQMDSDAASFFNRQAPLHVWLTAARSTALPQQLRNALAMGGWTRAVLLRDRVAANRFLPLLPEGLRAQASPGIGFPQWLVLVRNSGLTPYLNAGTQRSYSYDFVESYRENWCYRSDLDTNAPPAAFLTAAERSSGAKQVAALAPISEATLGREIVDYVAAHPNEPRAAEALYLVLRMVRYGCVSPAVPNAKPSDYAWGTLQMAGPQAAYVPEQQELLRVKQDAARLLRRRYPSSPWTKKSAPIAG